MQKEGLVALLDEEKSEIEQAIEFYKSANSGVEEVVKENEPVIENYSLFSEIKTPEYHEKIDEGEYFQLCNYEKSEEQEEYSFSAEMADPDDGWFLAKKEFEKEVERQVIARVLNFTHEQALSAESKQRIEAFGIMNLTLSWLLYDLTSAKY